MHDELRSRSVGELLTDLSRDTATLVRKELELARIEVGEIVTRAMRQTMWIASGAILCIVALFGLFAAAILALVASGMSAPLSALLVSIATLAAGGLLVAVGVSALRHMHFEPVETLQTLRQTAVWVRRAEHSHE